MSSVPSSIDADVAGTLLFSASHVIVSLFSGCHCFLVFLSSAVVMDMSSKLRVN